MFRRLKLRLAAWLIKGKPFQYQGRKPDGTWIKGDIIVTKEGLAAMKVAFRHNGSLYTDTALREIE